MSAVSEINTVKFMTTSEFCQICLQLPKQCGKFVGYVVCSAKHQNLNVLADMVENYFDMRFSFVCAFAVGVIAVSFGTGGQKHHKAHDFDVYLVQ